MNAKTRQRVAAFKTESKRGDISPLNIDQMFGSVTNFAKGSEKTLSGYRGVFQQALKSIKNEQQRDLALSLILVELQNISDTYSHVMIPKLMRVRKALDKLKSA